MPLVTLILFLLTTAVSQPVQAQTNVELLEQVSVEVWPDYDRPAVLVLITGALPASTSLPAAVTVPVPADADINAVARLTVNNQMVDDIQYTTGETAITLVTPELRFRVEYYMPYESSGDDRSFTFNWSGPTAVDQFDFTVQQPRAATSLNTSPGAETIITGSDGLDYYAFPLQSLTSGQAYSVDVTYTMPDPQLTAPNNNSPLIAELEPSSTTGSSTVSGERGIDWPLILTGAGLLLIVLAGIWQFTNQNRRRSTPVKPKPRRAEPRATPRKPRTGARPISPVESAPAGKANFCHECGSSLQAGDRFCRECGTQVKQR